MTRVAFIWLCFSNDLKHFENSACGGFIGNKCFYVWLRPY